MGLIKIEGKEVSLPDEIIAAGTTAIRAALSVDFPDVENADIEIVTPTRAGDPKAATVVKRGTGKGGFSLSSSRSRHAGGKSTREHVTENAAHVASELLRRAEANNRASVLIELATTSCACGSEDSHPDMHFVIAVGGPFGSPEEAMDALAETVVTQRTEILRADQRLRRGRDITGARQ